MRPAHPEPWGLRDFSREAFDAFYCCESQGGNIQVFDKMEVVESAGSGGDVNGVPTVGKKIERTLSPELLQEITVKVFNMRDDIIG